MNLFLAAKLPFQLLMSIGIIGGTLLVAMAYRNWRLSLKAALVLALFEGAIRKWVFPGGQELVYFLKDGVLLGAYMRFYLSPDPDIRAWKLHLPAGMITLCCIIACACGLSSNIGSVLLTILGVKLYMFYIPIAFMMPYLYRSQQEMLTSLTRYALIALPICLLGLLQWKSDRFSVLNTFASGMDQVTGATGFAASEKSRITGTFSYITGHATFVIFFSALHVSLLSIKETKYKWLLAFVNLPLLLANGMMNGSRATAFCVGLVILGFIFFSLIGRVGNSRKFLATLITVFSLALGGAVYFFVDAYGHYTARIQTSEDGVYFRVIGFPIKAVVHAAGSTGLTGLGIGISHPASEAMRNVLKIPRPRTVPLVYDMEIGQIIVDIGVLGWLAWYLMRITMLLHVFMGFRRAPPGTVINSIALCSFLISVPYFLLSVVMNHTASILLYATMGLAYIPFIHPAVVRRVQRGRAPASQGGSVNAVV